MLENIISLSDLLTRQKTYKAQLIDEVRDSKTKMGILYENVANGSVTTEEEAAALLSYKGPKDRNYKNLKGKLYQRLINTIFFIDQNNSQYADVNEAGKSCYKNYSAAKILMANKKRELAVDLVLRTFRASKKFEFTDLNYLISSLLSSHYSVFEIQNTRSQKYSRLRKEYLYALEAESDAEEALGQFSLRLSKSSKELSSQEIMQHNAKIIALLKIQETVKTRRFNLMVYLYQANFYLETRDYHKVNEIANEGIRFLEKKGIKSENETSLRTRGAIANFMMKNYLQAERQFLENIEIFSPNSINWFFTYHLYCSLMIVQKMYLEAYGILSKVFNTKQFERTHPLLIQLFKIKEAYIHFLVELGKIDPTQSEEAPLRKFRLNRFLNDVPTYSKDKRGVNISILIIQMILLVQNNKYNQVLDRLDALNMYSHRYLRSDNTFRSNCFIKMLAKLPDADYHPIRWARYVKKFRDRLDEHPFELSYHNLDIEVIPFENLYDLVLEMLEKGKKF